MQELDIGDPVGWAREAAAKVAEWAPHAARERSLRWFLDEGPREGARAGAAACEVASVLARRLDLAATVQEGLEQVYERWDGRGSPGRVEGERITVAARVAHVADVAEIGYRAGGVGAARKLVRARSGGHFDPALADVFERCHDELLDGLDCADVLALARDAEPGRPPLCHREDLARLARAIADFADLKCPWTLGHSAAVAELAVAAAPQEDADEPVLAGLLHDLGRVAVPNGIWDKRGPLSSGERERVRLHPYYTERILSRTDAFAHVAALAGAHHERLDGSGYHRGGGEGSLTGPMRCSPRPTRMRR